MNRQGDVLFTEIESLPKGLKKLKTDVIVWGEATGHAHRLVGGDVFSDANGMLFLDVKKSGKVVHEEHNTIPLKKGRYAVVRQREYTPEAIRTVVD